MSWLARIRLDYAETARRKIKDSYDWHQALWHAFPERDGERRSFLFRVKVHDDGHEVLLLSTVEPRRPDWCPESSWAIKAIQASFFNHRHYRFDLLVNATRKVSKVGPDGEATKNGRRTVLTKDGEVGDWLERKAGQSGFRILQKPPLVIEPRRDFHFRKGGASGLHVGVGLHGVLEVTDPQRFRQAFHQGIGSAKAFGFGMLLLQPLRSDLE